MVSIEGSDTMAALLLACKKSFRKENPDVPMSVTAADTSRGIKALLEGTTDIAAASRDLRAEESKLAHEKKVHLERKAIALDCIAVIANPKCPISEISIPGLKKAFTTEKVKWSDLGGSAASAVKVYVREPGSGTSFYFFEHIMGKEGGAKFDETPVHYAKSAVVVTSSDAVLEGVSGDVNAIGYVGLGKAHKADLKVKILKLKLAETSPAVPPSADGLATNYPLCRPLYMFYDANAKPTTRKFIDFCLSEAGQKIVKEQGYVSVK
jgi:ABC-type phosphate transport system, periplasmic component